MSYTCAGGLDNSGHFITHNAGLWWTIGIQALSRENICKIQTSSFHADQDFSFRRFWVRTFFDLHHPDITVRCGYDCSHESISYLSDRGTANRAPKELKIPNH